VVGEGAAGAGVDRKRVREETLKLLGGTPSAPGGPGAARSGPRPSAHQPVRPRPHAAAREGQARPVLIGREKGDRARHPRCCRGARKNNPVADRRAAWARPPSPRAWRSAIVSSQVPGEPQEQADRDTRPAAVVVRDELPRPVEARRLKTVMNEIRESEGHRDLHRRAAHHRGRGRRRGRHRRARTMLKPALGAPASCSGHRGDHARRVPEVQSRRTGALERRFQPIMVSSRASRTTIANS